VGSEMCIRDRFWALAGLAAAGQKTLNFGLR